MKKPNFIFFGLLALIFFPLIKVDAFSLYYNVLDQGNNDFKVEVGFDTEKTSLKAVEGLIEFNADFFKLKEISKNDTSFQRWSVEPFLNEDNQVFFNGVFSKDFKEGRKKLFELFFEKKSDKDLSLKLVSGAVLEKNDQLHNIEIFSKRKNSFFNLISLTHPNPEVWYSQKDVKFNWELPSDAQKVKLLIDKKPQSYPSVEYNDLITEKEIELDDGVWYFHIRYFGKNGWSPIEHRKIMIDTKKPLKNEVNVFGDLITMSAEDELSGVEVYEINIPKLQKKYFTNQDEFVFSRISSGVYDVFIKAYDRAGNFLEKIEKIEIKEKEAPHFLRAIPGKEEIYIQGYTNEPETEVYALIKGGEMDIERLAEVSNNGDFVYSVEGLDSGLYSLYLMTVSEDGFSQKDKKAIFIIDKKMSLDLMARILIIFIITILAIILFYVFCNNKKIKK